jgi:hypothetical protein
VDSSNSEYDSLALKFILPQRKVTLTPDTNATEPRPTGTIVNNTSGVEPTRNESAGAGEARTGPAQIGPIGPIDRSPLCDIIPEGCPTGHECPPECLIIAKSSDIQQGDIAAFEFTSTVTETATVANQSREVPITEGH